jgi:hypothetical protein
LLSRSGRRSAITIVESAIRWRRAIRVSSQRVLIDAASYSAAPPANNHPAVAVRTPIRSMKKGPMNVSSAVHAAKATSSTAIQRRADACEMSAGDALASQAGSAWRGSSRRQQRGKPEACGRQLRDPP